MGFNVCWYFVALVGCLLVRDLLKRVVAILISTILLCYQLNPFFNTECLTSREIFHLNLEGLISEDLRFHLQ